jgi:ketosteroid isomerase-like protein
MSHESAELLLRGYHAFVDGDFDAMEEMLDPDVEWVPSGESDAIVISRDRVLEVVAERAAENYHVVVDRAIGLADRVVVSMRFSRIELDPSDERPLQTRRSYLLGRWAAVVYTRDGRVVRVEEHVHLDAALEAVGLEDEGA